MISTFKAYSPTPTNRQRWAQLLAILGCGFTLTTTAIYFAWAAQPSRRLKITEIIGVPGSTVTTNEQPASVGTTLQPGQQVVTRQGNQVGLQLADDIVARLGSESAVTLEKNCLQLGTGEIVLSGVQGCVGAAIVDGADAIYVLERLGTLGEIKVLAGQVQVSVPGNPFIQSVSLAPNQKVTISLAGDEVGPVRLMLPNEVEQLVQGELFQGFAQPLANQNTIAALPKVAIAPSPTPKPTSPPPAPKPTPKASEVKPVAAHPKPAAAPVVTAPQPQKSYRTTPRYSYQAPAEEVAQSDYTPPSYRRRSPAPSYSDYYTRRRSRSAYPSATYHRKTPTYTPPAYTPPTYTPPPPTEKPVIDPDLPIVIEAPPVPMEPPAAAPIPAEIPTAIPPAPVVVEPIPVPAE